MTHTANAEPRMPHDHATPPAAPVREYRMTPEEAARYPAVRPTRADFHDAAEAGWTADRFAATYGRDAKHTEVLRKAFRSVLDARDMRRRRGEDEDERPPVERGPAVTTSEWIARIKAVLREHPDWSRRQVAESLGTTTGTVNNAMVRTGSNLTELRARVQRELAEAAETVDAGVQTTDTNADVNRMPVPVGNEWLTQVEALIRKHPHWRIFDYAKSLGITQKALEQRLHHRGLRLKELKLELIHGYIAPTTAPATPAPEHAPAGQEVDIPVVCRGCGATAPNSTETLHHNPSCPLVGPDLAEAPPQPADVPPPAPDDGGPTCPICHRAVADCNHAGDCERSGRHGAPDPAPAPAPEAPPTSVEATLTPLSPDAASTATGVNCTECCGPMIRHGTRYRCPECDAPEVGESRPGQTPLWVGAVTCTLCNRPASVCDRAGDCERSNRYKQPPLPGSVEHLAAVSICRTCVKADVCRHTATLADWFERAQLPDVDLDIELDIVVRRCEAYRGEGAA